MNKVKIKTKKRTIASSKSTKKISKKTVKPKVVAKSKPAKIAADDLVKKYRGHKGDTGSVEVQIALFTKKIESLAKHLKKHAKDNDSMRGLLQMVGKRRRLLNYLKKKEQKKYEKLILDLGLRK